MKLKQITKILEAEIITKQNEDLDIMTGCGSDLMSDVLVFTIPGSMLLSGLTNIQVIYTASTAGIRAVCFVRGKKPPQETVELAIKKKIALLTTKLPMYESCGRLYKIGLPGCSEVKGMSKE
jgi:hypothetical protein